MAKLTPQQIEFIKTMTPKQRRTLQSLTQFPFYMSASEHADPELYQLIRVGFAKGYSGVPDGYALWMWSATAAGSTAVKHFCSGR